jgi:6-phosphogluconolactonase (cycloisomerase 2 family)
VAALFAAVAMIPAQAMADGGQGSSSSSFTLFETGQVRPLAMSPDGQHLYAINTPDNSLEVFHISNDELEHVASVTVGRETTMKCGSSTICRTVSASWI